MTQTEKKQRDRLLTKEQNLRRRERLLAATLSGTQPEEADPKKNAVPRSLLDTYHSRPGRDTKTRTPGLLRRGLEKLKGLGRFVGTGWTVFVGGVGFLSGLFGLWVSYSVQPIVHSPNDVDPQNMLRIPFAVTNEDHFFTLYNVHPICGFDEEVPGFPVKNLSTNVEYAIGDLPPQSPPAHFRCESPVTPLPTIPGAKIFLTIQYDVRVAPGLYWSRSWQSVYRIARNGKDEPYWIEGEPLWRN